ncbi:MAG: uroporphyrinogen-III C-methyltransferase [Gammaproteobacteria bacterium RIFCSPLOWO2_12_FULL_52_10]|nr:MAG: uroporphyrinogen-III C-methyltransferase [Gammaproteobacteria bacterium RIFCSPLOWO2_12_FULL_52_10]
MGFIPIFLNIDGRRCLVVGGGEVASRKVNQLLKAGARVMVAAPRLCPVLERQRDGQVIEYLPTAFQEALLEGCELVIAATNDAAVNSQVSELAQRRHLPVNVVDNPGLCSFIMPSVVDRDPIQIAVSTGGASPVLARLLRVRLETLIPTSYGKLATLMQSFRERVKRKFPESVARRRFWEEVLQGPIAEMLFAGQERAALEALEQRLVDDAYPVVPSGEVYLVGGGPGDPDLLTFRALRLMQQADVVLYDRLVASEIVDLVRKEAERIYVGKESNRHALSQDEINQLLVKLARAGRRVLRLKGGDPFIFGRGGEEIDTLAAQGIPFQVVPGITAAAGCASYAGIPLTHRDYAQSCLFVTGHLKDGSLDLNWDALLQPQQTVAIYMGVGAIKLLSEELIKRGMSGTTPAAIIQQGTMPQQRVFISDLNSLPSLVATEDIKPPSMLILGAVVKLHERLAWYKPATS